MRAPTVASVCLGVVLLGGGWARGGLVIQATYDDTNQKWEDNMKVVVEDAIKEWMDVYCSSITVAIKFTWHDFSKTDPKYAAAWGLTMNFQEQDDAALKKKVPKSADVELNTLLKDKYYWDKTPGNTKDDKDLDNTKIDAASVLKHEVFHAIGFADNYTVYKAAAKQDGDLDKDGKNEGYLDYNNNGKYDAGELVLKEGDPSHTDDGFYKNKESFLMGIPGFGWGQQARPSSIEIKSLHEVYGYNVHIPEPSALAIWSLLGAIGFAVARRRRRG